MAPALVCRENHGGFARSLSVMPGPKGMVQVLLPATDQMRRPERVRLLRSLGSATGRAALRAACEARVVRLLPPREFFMRSEGQVRFLRLTTATQVRIAAVIAAALALWVGVMLWAVIGTVAGLAGGQTLAQREAAVTRSEDRIARYRARIDAAAHGLERRQDFIEKALQGTIGPLPADRPATEAPRPLHHISATVPEAQGLAHAEARQIALVDRLTRAADARSEQASATIRKVGLAPAEGGPLIRLATGPGNETEPRFARLAMSLARLNTMNQGLARIPNAMPAMAAMSSGFGLRTDPIDGDAAFHPGLDFRGPVGAPITAAAAGIVSFAGRRQGYGNCVEVTHGKGLVTRYAHMSRILARVGQSVIAGSPLGAIGSTGRSTGPHLHFEVRINDRPVNPRPFLEARTHVFQETGGRDRPLAQPGA